LIKVFSGVHAARRLVLARRLSYATSHRLSLHVLVRVTLVQVDGVTVALVPATPGSTGGVAVGAKRNPGQPWPRLGAITVAPLR
jgi:hypothetical protein